MDPERFNSVNGNELKNAANVLTSNAGSQLPFNASNVQAMNPPPLPPRPSMQPYSGYNDYRSTYGNYGNYYGNYGNNYYRGFGAYGGYMGYPSGPTYNNYRNIAGPSGDVESRFTHYLEESSRSTFHTVETVLQTFSSITMLLESTYIALTNSFKAVLNVAENIGKLRSMIGQLLSTFALIRLLKWIYGRITYIFGFQRKNLEKEELWQRSLAQVIKGEKKTSSWQSFLFLSIFIAIPYLIHKISQNIKHIQAKGTDPKEWPKGKEPVFVANALYNFTATSNSELSLTAGQKIWLAPQSLQPKIASGWWTATDGTNVGLVPSNYIKIVAELKKRPQLHSKTFTASTSKTFTQEAGVSSKENPLETEYIDAENNLNTQSFEKINENVENEADVKQSLS